MAAPFTPDQPFKDINVINESERSVDPTDDVGKLVQLEADGKISEQFIPSPRQIIEFTATGVFERPTTGSLALLEVWSAAGGGAAAKGSASNIESIGTGGSGGGYLALKIPINVFLPSTDIIIGNGGAGGSTSTAGGRIDGADGGATVVEGIVRLLGGKGGKAIQSATDFQSDALDSFENIDYILNPDIQVLGGKSGITTSTFELHTSVAPASTHLAGAGGGNGSVSRATPDKLQTDGAMSSFLLSKGGDGFATKDSGILFTAEHGETACGGGGIASNNSPGTITAGNGGDGYVRISIY